MADTKVFHTIDGMDAPAFDAFAVTASDSAVFDPVPRALYIGGAGDVAARMASGRSVTFTDVPAGTILPVRADQVLSTGTNATAIVALV